MKWTEWRIFHSPTLSFVIGVILGTALGVSHMVDRRLELEAAIVGELNKAWEAEVRRPQHHCKSDNEKSL